MLTKYGQQVRDFRIKYGMSLYDLHLMLNLSCAYLSAVENGRKQLTEDLVYEVSKAIGLNAEEEALLIQSGGFSLDDYKGEIKCLI